MLNKILNLLSGPNDIKSSKGIYMTNDINGNKPFSFMFLRICMEKFAYIFKVDSDVWDRERYSFSEVNKTLVKD